jgi:hypothetical protein
MEISDKDIYEYIANLADDRTVLNMLAVNRKFNDDLYFKKILENRYPLLIRHKEENKTYKQFYLKIVKDLAELWEKYKIPYIPSINFYPEYALSAAKSRVFNLYSLYLMDALEIGDIKLAQYLVNKGGKISGFTYHFVAKLGNLEMLKFLMNVRSDESWLKDSLRVAKEYNNISIINYLESLGVKE